MMELLLSVFMGFTLPIMNGDVGAMFTPKNNSVLVVEAYFNACPYCHQNAPQVDDLASFYEKESRIEVLDVGVDRRDSDYTSWISKHQPNHLVLKDSDRKIISQLGTKSYPSTYILNCHGDVVFKTSGVWSKNTRQKIEDAIDAALDVMCD